MTSVNRSTAREGAPVPDPASGSGPGRGRLAGRRVLIVGGGQQDHGLEDPPIGNGRAMSVLFAREGAAVEGAPSIRFNLVVPGLIDTPLGRQASAISDRRDRVRIPARRQGTAWEVAHTALFLLGEESSYITGQSLVVDGGLSVAPRSGPPSH